MTPRCLYIVLFILTACNSKPNEKKANLLFGQRISFKSPDLAVSCTRAIKTIDNEVHGVSFMSNTGKSPSNGTVSSLLSEISRYEITNNDNYETYLRTCSKVDFLTWMSKTHKKNVITRIEKVYFKTIIPLSHGDKNIISITDFDIYSINKPNHVAIRVIDDYELEYLKIDEDEYIRIAESIPAGLDIAMAKFGSAKKNACK